MKAFTYSKNILAAWIAVASILSASGQSTSAPATAPKQITISGSRFTYDLLRNWIDAFNAKNPEAVIQIVPRETSYAEQADLVINAHVLDSTEIRPGYKYVNIARYALLPVSNAANPLIESYFKKGLSQNDLKTIYFNKFEFAEAIPEKTKKSIARPIQVYTRERIACANTAFASYYGFVAKDIKGKRIVGEDKHLLYAVRKDTFGITYNNAGYIFNTETRQLQPGLKIIPTEELLKASQNDPLVLTNLDAFINFSESATKADYPIEYIHLSYKDTISPDSIEWKFLQYILTEGQAQLHQYGFLISESAISKASQKQLGL